LADFVTLIEGLAGRKANLVPAPMPDTDIAYTYADISKARRLLNYEPRVSVQEGVACFWQWYERAVLSKVGLTTTAKAVLNWTNPTKGETTE
jgi:UDP-glucuronate 4-epimerase